MALQILNAGPDPEKIIEQIRSAIAGALPGAEIEVRAARPGHFEIQVTSEAFADAYLADTIAELGLSNPGDDDGGRAILAALRTASHQPCDEQSFSDTLSGALGSGRVDQGVELLRYSQYDGRPAERLVLTGVHDGGIARAPMMGVYADGEWLIEGHGVEPDIVVDNLPHATFEGGDAQLDAAIDHLLALIAEDPRAVPAPPAYPDKSSPDNRRR